MKYLLIYWLATVSPFSSSYECSYANGATCSSVGNVSGRMSLEDSKDACMARLKGMSDPTQGYCVPVNGFTRELKAY